MTALRRNEVVLFSASGPINWAPGAIQPGTVQTVVRITLDLSAARVADFELRTGVKIEQAILDFLDDQIFALTDVPPAPSGGPSTSRE